MSKTYLRPSTPFPSSRHTIQSKKVNFFSRPTDVDSETDDSIDVTTVVAKSKKKTTIYAPIIYDEPRKDSTDSTDDYTEGGTVLVKMSTSVFGQSIQHIVEMLESEDTDGAITLTQKHLLRTILLLLPKAEEVVLNTKTGRGVHNFTMLINQTRELMSDIQQSRDTKFLAAGINLRVLQPAMIDIANMMINEHARLKGLVLDKIPAEQVIEVNTAIDQTSKNVARYMENQYRDMRTKIEEHLG